MFPICTTCVCECVYSTCTQHKYTLSSQTISFVWRFSHSILRYEKIIVELILRLQFRLFYVACGRIGSRRTHTQQYRDWRFVAVKRKINTIKLFAFINAAAVRYFVEIEFFVFFWSEFGITIDGTDAMRILCTVRMVESIFIIFCELSDRKIGNKINFLKMRAGGCVAYNICLIKLDRNLGLTKSSNFQYCILS